MRQFAPIVLLLALLAACGPDRAQTIDPIPITPAPTSTPLPTETKIPTLEPPTAEPPTPTPPPTTEPQPSSTPLSAATPTREPTALPPTPTPPPPAPSTPPPSGDAPDIDQADLLARLITIGDMPTGWAGKGAVFEPRTPGGTYTSFCAELPARSIAAAYADFEKSALGPFLSESIVVYPDRADARAALDDLTAAAQNCPTFTDSSGSTNTLSPLSFPSFGEATFAVRSSGAVEMDAIYILVDNVLINIRHGGLGAVDSALTETIARAALDRYNP